MIPEFDNPQNYLIQETSALETFLAQVQSSFITVDTEFIRENTYWPQVCLIQLAHPGGACAVDPLAPGIDLTPLWKFLSAPNRMKVFHAARQDLEGFFVLIGRLPKPFFDTQVAALACALGDNISYENLVSTLLGHTLDKSERVIDWSRRPLTDKQIIYALSDVTHLCTLYPLMVTRLKEWDRMSWIQEEMDLLGDETTYQPHPQEAWKRVKGWGAAQPLTAQGFALLQSLSSWREEIASSQNIPRRRLLRDERLCELVSLFEKDPELLKQYPCQDPLATLLRRLSHEIPAIPESDLCAPPAIKLPSERERVLYRSLSQLLKESAAKAAIAPRLIGTRGDLEHLISKPGDSLLLQGWRKTVFGEKALALIEESEI